MADEHCPEVIALEKAVESFQMLDRDAAERALVYLQDRFVLSVARPPTKMERMQARHEGALAEAVATARADEREKCAAVAADYAGPEAGPERDIAISKAISARTE